MNRLRQLLATRIYTGSIGMDGADYGTNGGSGVAGGTGVTGTFSSPGGFCIACWLDNLFE